MTDGEYGQLIAFLGRQFEAIDRRFDAVDERFREMRGEMLGHFDELYRRLERLEQEYQLIVHALRRIEGSQEDLERNVAELREQVALIQVRLDALEQRIQE